MQMSDLTLADYAVLLAGACYFIGYLITNQIYLRLSLMIGTGFYIWYYAIVDETPLWAPIWISVSLTAANLTGIFSLWLRKSPLSIPARDKDIYEMFSVLPPGDFRKLMRVAHRHRLPAGSVLTREGQPVTSIYFILSGVVDVEKFGERFHLPDRIFLGEVAYLTGEVASATTLLVEDGDVLKWDVAQIRRHAKRDVRFKLALDALVSMDLARKVARAGAPQARPAGLSVSG
jgi:hypothetical protein